MDPLASHIEFGNLPVLNDIQNQGGHEALDGNIEVTVIIKKELLDILACPKCKGPIALNEAQSGLVCHDCKLLYEIREGIPIMLIDEAKPLQDH